MQQRAAIYSSVGEGRLDICSGMKNMVTQLIYNSKETILVLVAQLMPIRLGRQIPPIGAIARAKDCSLVTAALPCYPSLTNFKITPDR